MGSLGYSTKRLGIRRPREHNGYIEEWCPDRGKYVYQHRLIVERQIGRYLRPEERVHHRNHNRLDNEPSNLLHLPSQSAHIAEHVAEGTWGGRGIPRPQLQRPQKPCPMCGTMFKPSANRVATCSQSCGQRYRHRK